MPNVQLKPKVLLKGLFTFLPWMSRLACRSSGGTVSARYCYSVWLRHLALAAERGLPASFTRVAELGPGDSFGIGLAAMLSGMNQYYALDAKPHASPSRNLEVFEELVTLFRMRTPIPDDCEFPGIRPQLSSYNFPGILTDKRLSEALAPARIDDIRLALKEGTNNSSTIQIHYVAPWTDQALLNVNSIDMIFSQAVLEHVENAPGVYTSLARCLRPGGLMSHSIDYKSHNLTHNWNGHWTVPDFIWKFAKGRRPYFINRHPHSVHVNAMREAGLEIITELTTVGLSLPRRLLTGRYKTLSDQDLETDGAFIQARKNDSGHQPGV